MCETALTLNSEAFHTHPGRTGRVGLFPEKSRQHLDGWLYRQQRTDLYSFGRRAFSVAGPMVWNSLPDFLRDTSLSKDTFRRIFKDILFCFVLKHVSALEALCNALYKFSTYLLTYNFNSHQPIFGTISGRDVAKWIYNVIKWWLVIPPLLTICLCTEVFALCNVTVVFFSRHSVYTFEADFSSHQSIPMQAITFHSAMHMDPAGRQAVS